MRNARNSLIEPVPVDDDLCTELALIEDLGWGARFVLVSQQTCYEAGTPVCVVKRKIALPYAAIRPAIGMAIAFMGRRPPRVGRVLRLVK